MSYDLEEQEQIDALKAWWAKNGNFILTVVTVVLFAAAAWQGWGWYQRNQAGQAAGYFEALQSAATQGNAGQVRDASQQLRDRYSGTAYAPRGALLAAHALQNGGDLAGARDQLQWVINQGDAAFAPVASLRLAAVLIDMQEHDAALKVLSDTPPAGFEALYADSRGDVLFAQGKVAEAVASWRAALEGFGPTDALGSLVQLKIDALGDNA